MPQAFKKAFPGAEIHKIDCPAQRFAAHLMGKAGGDGGGQLAQPQCIGFDRSFDCPMAGVSVYWW